jgi:hypothetical protein
MTETPCVLMEGNMINVKFAHATLGIFTKALETDENEGYKYDVLRTSITYVRISNKELMRISEGKVRT